MPLTYKKEKEQLPKIIDPLVKGVANNNQEKSTLLRTTCAM